MLNPKLTEERNNKNLIREETIENIHSNFDSLERLTKFTMVMRHKSQVSGMKEETAHCNFYGH